MEKGGTGEKGAGGKGEAGMEAGEKAAGGMERVEREGEEEVTGEEVTEVGTLLHCNKNQFQI